MKLRKCNNPERECTKVTDQVEIRNDSIYTNYLNLKITRLKSLKMIRDQTEEPQDVVFHQPMKLSQLVQKYLKHQPAKFVTTIHQQQLTNY